MNDQDKEHLRELIRQADESGLKDPTIELARTVLANLDMEDAIAKSFSSLGVDTITWEDEGGTVTQKLEWDENGNVKREEK